MEIVGLPLDICQVIKHELLSREKWNCRPKPGRNEHKLAVGCLADPFTAQVELSFKEAQDLITFSIAHLSGLQCSELKNKYLLDSNLILKHKMALPLSGNC